MTKLIKVVAGLCLLSLSSAVSADYVETDWFTLKVPGPSVEERDPLGVIVQLNFPPSVVTVHDALVYALRRSGWDFVVHDIGDDALRLTAERPLPDVHRELSVMSLRDVVQTLVGRHFDPLEDPIRRLYTFELKKQYQGLVGNE